MTFVLCGHGVRVQVEGFIVADAMRVQACATHGGGGTSANVAGLSAVPSARVLQKAITSEKGATVGRAGGSIYP